jgi:hypothetical protein
MPPRNLARCRFRDLVSEHDAVQPLVRARRALRPTRPILRCRREPLPRRKPWATSPADLSGLWTTPWMREQNLLKHSGRDLVTLLLGAYNAEYGWLVAWATAQCG